MGFSDTRNQILNYNNKHNPNTHSVPVIVVCLFSQESPTGFPNLDRRLRVPPSLRTRGRDLGPLCSQAKFLLLSKGILLLCCTPVFKHSHVPLLTEKHGREKNMMEKHICQKKTSPGLNIIAILHTLIVNMKTLMS